ncbi:putative 52 kDa repressor of the inhibitor of the protein kinase-like 19 [Homarus americanus]|uniref:Putative 52 kDa repressor of the inhibitor of the protein kinase-like 19 n=1 Tax=Homarus americanus TaxID=6706 RepID=A0A8J5JVB0_HOMAM|nr:putative 52 kDa repressor of the inhibitor of the protein kinase-like 19 [Homarus americanus]
MDDHYTEWFRQVVGVAPSMPRLCKCQRHRDNTLADGLAEYYRRMVAIPLLDHLLAELEMRFTPLYQKPSRDTVSSHQSW